MASYLTGSRIMDVGVAHSTRGTSPLHLFAGPPEHGFLMQWASRSPQASILQQASLDAIDPIYEEAERTGSCGSSHDSEAEHISHSVLGAIEASIDVSTPPVAQAKVCPSPLLSQSWTPSTTPDMDVKPLALPPPPPISLHPPPPQTPATVIRSASSQEAQAGSRAGTGLSHVNGPFGAGDKRSAPVFGMGFNLKKIAERIWQANDQKASLYLQERLRQAVPGEYEQLVEIISEQAEPLMIHRFGNFLVQCMLELARQDELEAFVSRISGMIAELSQNQFCCHVIQKLLDVSPLVIQAKVAAELLDNALDTMISPFGTHVWQKLLHLSWSSELPPITVLANNAVHITDDAEGWLAVARTDAGCASIKSFLGVPTIGDERQQCTDELLGGVDILMSIPSGAALVSRLAMSSATRAKLITQVIAKAVEYATHPVASLTLISLLHLKIPSFPSRLSASLMPHADVLRKSRYAEDVISALRLAQGKR